MYLNIYIWVCLYVCMFYLFKICPSCHGGSYHLYFLNERGTPYCPTNVHLIS